LAARGEALNTRLRFPLLAILSAFAVSACGAEVPPLADSFSEADVLSDQHSSTPEGKVYEQEQVVPHHQEVSSRSLAACYKSVAEPDVSAFKLIIAISEAGTVERVYMEPETNLSLCVTSALLSDTFPQPPFSPFYQGFFISFTP
jgi:hypothetical protein